MLPGEQFFVLDPAKPDTAPALVQIKEGSLPQDLSAFTVSPDGRLVAVVEGGTDAVAVLDLAGGKVKLIAPAHDGWKTRLLPAWRNPQQLVYAGLASPAATRPELLMWPAEAKPRSLSATWPDAVVNPWLEAPNSK